jgi:hypothetical protein
VVKAASAGDNSVRSKKLREKPSMRLEVVDLLGEKQEVGNLTCKFGCIPFPLYSL